jgi:hypothetical protein
MLRAAAVADRRHKRASLAEGVRRIPAEKEVMLLPVKQDALIPAQELEYLASLLGAQVLLTALPCRKGLCSRLNRMPAIVAGNAGAPGGDGLLVRARQLLERGARAEPAAAGKFGFQSCPTLCERL